MKEFTLLCFLKQTCSFVRSKEITEANLFTHFKANIFNPLIIFPGVLLMCQ